MKISNYLKKNRVAIGFSLIYVFFGGIGACAYYPIEINSNWWFIGWIITFPVNIASCILGAYGSVGNFPVLAIQSVMLLPTYILTLTVLKKRNHRD